MEPNRIKDINEAQDLLCLWTQAGVVQEKVCDSDYECAPCSYDIDMRRIAEKNRKRRERGDILKGANSHVVFWKDRLKDLPLSRRPCIHHMKQRIEFRSCTNEYVCGDCEFDQYFHDQHTVHAVVKPVDVLSVQGFKIPQGYYLHRGHAWMKLEEGSEVRVGLDDFSLRLLGPLDRIESPLVGKEVSQGVGGIKINRGEYKAEVLSPVSGVVTAINHKLMEDGRMAGTDPYTEGWVMRIHSNSLRDDIKHLLIGNETGEYIKNEVRSLHNVIEEEAGPLAADGGLLTEDIFGKIPQLKWDKLTKLFLHN